MSVLALRKSYWVGLAVPISLATATVLATPQQATAAILLLLGVALALSAVFAWIGSRARSQTETELCFPQRHEDLTGLNKRKTSSEIVPEFRRALDHEEFEVVYQPQFNLATERQCGFEALIRWHHPVHGEIAPSHFIAVAEDTGFIAPLGRWVLRRACSDAAAWPDALFVSVNLSPAQFYQDDVALMVAGVLRETGLAPSRLELEITENLLIGDTDDVLDNLNRLRQLGVSIAMDDFGTGYSSLSYLSRFPFSKIKIDRQFIRSMTHDQAMRAIVKTIIALGRSLGVTITAEGVETVEQAAMLRAFGCPQVQGFLYGYPGPAVANIIPRRGRSAAVAGRQTSVA